MEIINPEKLITATGSVLNTEEDFIPASARGLLKKSSPKV
jgi:hypothetical protein